jgi:hypothetical protein
MKIYIETKIKVMPKECWQCSYKDLSAITGVLKCHALQGEILNAMYKCGGKPNLCPLLEGELKEQK